MRWGYWLAPDAPPLIPPAAAPPLAADGALIAPVLPASVPEPPLLSARLQPAAPIVNIAIAVITMTFLKFEFIANSPAWFTPGLHPGSFGDKRAWIRRACRDMPIFRMHISLGVSAIHPLYKVEEALPCSLPDNARSGIPCRNKHA
jgi:hypothetical protein